MKKIYLGVLFSLALFSMSIDAYCQDNTYKLQSVFIIRFAKYIEWPQGAKSGDFTIGILGDDNAEQAVKSIVQGKSVGSQTIKVRKFNSVAEVSACNILYITFPKSSNFYAALAKVKGSSTLVITEKEGLVQKGSDINFVVNQGKMNFEVNKQATEKSGLKIPANVLSLATVYNSSK